MASGETDFGRICKAVLASFTLVQTTHTLLFVGYFLLEQAKTSQLLIASVPIGFLAAWLFGLPLELYTLRMILRSRPVSWGLSLILAGNVVVLARHEWAVGVSPLRFILLVQLVLVPFVVVVCLRAMRRLGIGSVDWVALGCTLVIGLSCILVSWRYFPVLQEWEETPRFWERILWESRFTWPTECSYLLFGVVYLGIMSIFTITGREMKDATLFPLNRPGNPKPPA